MNAGQSDIMDLIHQVAHDLRGNAGLLGDGDVAGPRAHHGDLAPSLNRAIAPEANRPCAWKILPFRTTAEHRLGAFRSNARDQNIGTSVEQRSGNPEDFVSGLSRSEEHTSELQSP